MGVASGWGSRVDINAISEEMRQAVRLWENAYIVILNPGPNGSLIRTKSPTAILWHGYARVQPYRRENQIAQQTDPVTTQTVRFQVDFSKDGNIPDIKTDYCVWVLPESLSGVAIPDPFLSQYRYDVNASMNSSFAWIRTIEAVVNSQIRIDPADNLESDGAGGYQWIGG